MLKDAKIRGRSYESYYRNILLLRREVLGDVVDHGTQVATLLQHVDQQLRHLKVLVTKHVPLSTSECSSSQSNTQISKVMTLPFQSYVPSTRHQPSSASALACSNAHRSRRGTNGTAQSPSSCLKERFISRKNSRPITFTVRVDGRSVVEAKCRKI